MEINIIRGQNQIGGSIIEISSKNIKIILDKKIEQLKELEEKLENYRQMYKISK